MRKLLLGLALVLAASPRARADAALDARALAFASADRTRKCTVEEWRFIKRAVHDYCAPRKGDDYCREILARLTPWYVAIDRNEVDRAHAEACTVRRHGDRVHVEKAALYVFSGFTWHVELARDRNSWRVARATYSIEDYE